MRNLQVRAEQLARAEQRRRIDRIARQWAAQVPGLSVLTESGGIVVSGRGLLRRWLADPVLRFSARIGL